MWLKGSGAGGMRRRGRRSARITWFGSSDRTLRTGWRWWSARRRSGRWRLDAAPLTTLCPRHLAQKWAGETRGLVAAVILREAPSLLKESQSTGLDWEIAMLRLIVLRALLLDDVNGAIRSIGTLASV